MRLREADPRFPVCAKAADGLHRIELVTAKPKLKPWPVNASRFWRCIGCGDKFHWDCPPLNSIRTVQPARGW